MSEPSGSECRRALRWLVGALAGTFAVLVLSGLYQAFRYFPYAPGAAPFSSRATESVHRWSAYPFLVVLLATAVTCAMRGPARRAAWIGLGVAALGAVAAIVTGPELRWDQLALWAVTVGTDRKGIFQSSSVKFILRGTQEIGLGDYRRTVWLHVLAFPTVALAGIAVLWYGVRRGASRAAKVEREEVTV